MMRIFPVFLVWLGCLLIIGGCKSEEPRVGAGKDSVQAPAPPAPAKTMTSGSGMEFVLIPSGSFTMGCNKNFEDCSDDETPQHQVTISRDFYLGKHEVTQAQWVAVMGDNPSKFKGRTNPVEQVSWEDVQRFIEKLNQMEGKKYRLPTEAEWEYACRAGSTTTYSFGDEKGQLGQYAWFDGNSGEQTHPVGQLQPNAWGLYDMHGNIWEWVSDWHENYSTGPQTDPVGPSSGVDRVLRGCSWGTNRPEYVRSAARSWFTPGYRSDTFGFRLVAPQVR